MLTSSHPELTTTKRVAEIGPLTLASGETLSEVALGYETYGTLDAARDNAVLICHYFSGSSHAAGRYRPDDALPGWWNPVIGPGKAIDTERFFVIAIDALGCVRQDAPHGVTTSAASRNPATGRPYGPDFPAIAVADMVESQRRLLELLGISRLAAVAGPSLGAMQALSWAVTHPERVDRVIAAIGLAELQAREIGLYRVMEDAIRLDPAFQGGRYAPGTPLAGLAIALKLMILLAGGREELSASLGRRPAQEPGAEWAMEAWLEREGAARAAVCDANSWIAMLRANMRWDLGALEAAVAELRSRVLLIPGLGDELVPPKCYHTPLEQALRWKGADFSVAPLPARHGHLAGLLDIERAAGAMRACLETPVR